MDELIHVENKEPAPQKPPLSVVRIAGEVLAGTAVGVAAGWPAVLGFGICVAPLVRDRDCFGGGGLVAAAAAFLFVFPAAYGLGSAVGVYLVGNTGKQTGSFLLTLYGGLGGGLIMSFVQVFSPFLLAPFFSPGMEEPSYSSVLTILLIPSIAATWGFNFTRQLASPRLTWFRGTTLALLLAVCSTLLIDVLAYPRVRAQWQLDRMNSRAAPLAELIEGLKSRDVRVRQAAAKTLGRLGYRAKPALPALADALKDEDEVVRWRARAAIARIESEWKQTVKPE